MSNIVILAYGSAGFAALLGLGYLLHGRRTISHWFFFLGILDLAADAIFTGLSLQADSPEAILRWQSAGGCALAFLPFLWLGFSLTYSRGNYREFLARWRLVLQVTFIIPVILLVGTLLGDGPGLYDNLQKLEHTDDSVLPLTPIGKALNLFFLIGILLALTNLEKTFRTTVGTLRWRIKFVVLGLCVIFGTRIYICSQSLLYSHVILSLSDIESGSVLIGCLLIAISYLRTGRLEVDVYPSHTFLYSSITILLTGVYLLTVGSLAKIVMLIGGDSAFPLKAFLVLLGIVGLAVILLSDRVRQTTQRFISRNFKRPLYDSRKVWSQFTEKTAHATDPASLCEATTKLISDTFNVLSATVWLVDETEKQIAFVASTALPSSQTAQRIQTGTAAEPFLTHLRDHPYPFDLDETIQPWAAELRQTNPANFLKGGHRICVPIIAAERPLGLIVLGDRVQALPYSQEELDLLHCIGGHIGAGLLTIQLSKKLMEANEQEAFRAVSAFFAHDLKNAASTLSLMLQNLPLHFDDPEFRADVLRGISKTVNHMNHLISRLSVLRQKPELRIVAADLNHVVTTALARWKATAEITITTDLQPLPPLQLDPEQIQNIVTNLVLNAHEAIGTRGQIRVQTARQNDWAVLTVTDSGCGMDTEFLRRSLFRPFQTTKKGGTGIGMFQCKLLVEAHHGKIEVESQPGQGASFRVHLPLP